MKLAALGIGALDTVAKGIPWVTDLIAHKLGNDAANSVRDAVKAKLAAGVPWSDILAALLPFLLQLFAGLFGGGGTVTAKSIVAAVNKLKPAK